MSAQPTQRFCGIGLVRHYEAVPVVFSDLESSWLRIWARGCGDNPGVTVEATKAAVKAQIEQTIAAADSALGELHAIAKGRRRARKG